MKITTILFLGLCANITFAVSAHSRPLLETTEQSRQRHNAERYEQYKANNYQAPLGGYRETLGDTAPYGTERPGYTSPKTYGSPNNGAPNRSNSYGY